MPRLTLNKPKPDYIKGLIMERMNALAISNEEMAATLDVSRATWFKMMNVSTTEWKLGKIIKACRLLGIPVEDLRQAIRMN